MYIPNTMPKTLAEMLAFLQPTVADGLFDSVTYDNESSPTKIVCSQDGNVIFEISGGASFNMFWYIASGTTASSPRTWTGAIIYNCMRCKYGVYFDCDVGSDTYALIVTTTSNNKTGFISVLFNKNITSTSFRYTNTYYTACMGDNTNLDLYTNGYVVSNNSGSSDRTILTKLPVVGERGSLNYFTGAFVRNVVQIFDTSEQIIAGKHYGCIKLFAILDE